MTAFILCLFPYCMLCWTNEVLVQDIYEYICLKLLWYMLSCMCRYTFTHIIHLKFKYIKYIFKILTYIWFIKFSHFLHRGSSGTVAAPRLAPTGVSWADKVKAHHTGSTASSDVAPAPSCPPVAVQKPSRRNGKWFWVNLFMQ